MGPEGEYTHSSTLSLPRHKTAGGQHHASAAFTPGKEPVHIVQKAEWAPGPVWVGAENLTPPAFDPRTFQPVASRYTD
jgi:hypothetical protein